MGILFGFFLGIALAAAVKLFDGSFVMQRWAFLMMCPLVVDGVLQKVTKYRSNNIKRLLTGLMFGVAVVFSLINLHLFSVELAKKFVDYMGLSRR